MTWKYKIIFIFVMMFINMVSPLCFNTVSDYSIYLITSEGIAAAYTQSMVSHIEYFSFQLSSGISELR